MESQTGTKMADPKLQTAKTCRAAKEIMTGILDDGADIAIVSKSNSRRDKADRRCINSISRACADRTITRSFTCSHIDRWTAVVNGVTKSNRTICLEASIRPCLVNNRTLCSTVQRARIARDGDRLRRYQLAID